MFSGGYGNSPAMQPPKALAKRPPKSKKAPNGGGKKAG